MILCRIEDSARYDAIALGVALATRWLREHSGDSFVIGSMEIGDAGAGPVVVKCEEPSMQDRERAQLEAHRRFIDIHVPLKGTEIIGWAPVASLLHQREDYDPDRDIVFFGDSAHSLLHVKVGQIAVFFPEDAHAPNIGLGKHRKLCIKIPV